MSLFKTAIHGRVQFESSNSTLGLFTVPQGAVTYIIVAQLTNKWVPFWSTSVDTADMPNQFPTIISAAAQNVINFFADLPATENINDQVIDIANAL